MERRKKKKKKENRYPGVRPWKHPGTYRIDYYDHKGVHRTRIFHGSKADAARLRTKLLAQADRITHGLEPPPVRCQSLFSTENYLKALASQPRMASISKLVAIGVQLHPDFEFSPSKVRATRYYLNIWDTGDPNLPTQVPVPYRGGYIGGFNDLLTPQNYVFLADGEGILCHDLSHPSKGHVELKGVDEVSDQFCKTSKHLISGLHHVLQVRSLDDILSHLEKAQPSDKIIDVPYQELEYRSMDEGDTILSMLPFGPKYTDKIILNTADDKTFLFDPNSLEAQAVLDHTGLDFPHRFQRREKYHFIQTDLGEYLVVTESTSDKQHPNRVYSINIRGPPSIKELEALELHDKQILSMNRTSEYYLQLLIKYRDKTFLQLLHPFTREIQDSRELKRKYDLGDRLHQVGDQLLIVRHLKDQIVDAESEEYIKLSGAENNVAIPEISSTWEYPQYLCVAPSPAKS